MYVKMVYSVLLITVKKEANEIPKYSAMIRYYAVTYLLNEEG